MPFIPHTPADLEAMLAAIGVVDIDSLFDEIPAELRARGLDAVPPGMSEAAIGKLMRMRASSDGEPVCFIGAGAYDHHIPAAVWELVTRGEFYSAYTPYQAEASQGTLQLVYEFQSMVASLMGMDVSNASLYDGASALAEAVLMAVRANRKVKSTRVLVPGSLHPAYRDTVDTIVRNQGIELVDVAYDPESGRIDAVALEEAMAEPFVAMVIQQPNFFGVLELVDALTDAAHAHNAIVVGCVNPLAMTLLTPPGAWGTNGADIACGEGQPLGLPLSSGGPYLGLLACKQALVRQMPGRIVGRTVDLDGKPGFTLTLQAREQHIRRSKATSNICTNQGLMAAAATIHMAMMGPAGLTSAAQASHANTRTLAEKLTAIGGVEPVFTSPYFHELVVRLPVSAEDALRALAVQEVLGGYHLGRDYPELENCLLVCATEKRTEEEIDDLVHHLTRVVGRLDRPVCTRLKPAENPF